MARVSGKTDIDAQLPKLGKAVRLVRKERGLSQEALADASGIDQSHMGKIERGERNLTFLTVSRIARALDCRVSALLERVDL
jgi:transcriptional regulator with XRE-family HTH domain